MYFAGGTIPNYIVVTQWLGLQDSVWSIILPNAISTFNLLVMKSFFAGLPEELEEAASIDGMDTYRILLRLFFRYPSQSSQPCVCSIWLVCGMNGLPQCCT